LEFNAETQRRPGAKDGQTEALSDNGSLAGRGHPWARGSVCGLMTTLGGIGHTLPYLIPNVKTATSVGVCAVLVELGVISWRWHKFRDTALVSALLQVALSRAAKDVRRDRGRQRAQRPGGGHGAEGRAWPGQLL
jgi:hypothetical protein